MRWTARRRLVAAGVGALALHALLALFIAAQKPPPPAVAHKPAPPVPIALIERQTSAVPAPPQATPSHPKGTAGAGRGRPSPAAPQPPPAAGAATPGATPERWSQEWQTAEGVHGPPSGARGGLTMRLGEGELNFHAGTPDGPVREGTREEKLAEEKRAVERTIEGWAGDVTARERARTPDAYWHGVKDALGKGFDPGWDMLAKGPGESSGGVRSQFWDSWKQQAEAYGKTGNPYGGEERRSLNEEFLAMRNDERGLGSVSLGSVPQGVITFDVVARGLAGKSFTHQLVAMVKITQREDGSIFNVELFSTSGNASYDRTALQQARELHVGPPKQSRQTLWAFETTFTQIPPAPIAGCALDDFVPKNCFYPLQKLARSRITLLAIY